MTRYLLCRRVAAAAPAWRRIYSTTRFSTNSIDIGSSSSSSSSALAGQNPNHRLTPPWPALLQKEAPASPPRSVFFYAALIGSATAAAAAAAIAYTKDGGFTQKMEESLEKSLASLRRIYDGCKQTGVAATVLLTSLRSVLSSANQEVRSGFELRVASLLADISSASESRRSAIVAAGGGAVVDWLLETVSCSGPTQSESARALSYLIADANVCEAVLARPHVVHHLLRFIFSSQPHHRHSNKVRAMPLFLLTGIISCFNFIHLAQPFF